MRMSVVSSLLFATGCSVDAPHYVVADPVDASTPIADGAVPAFDVVYPTEWRFLYAISDVRDRFVVFVDRSDQPLAMGGLTLVSMEDDHPIASVRFQVQAGATTVGSELAGGALSEVASDVLSPLVVEPRTDTDSSYLSIEVLDAPEGEYSIQASLTVRLDGVELDLPTTIHIVSGLTTWADPIAGGRVTAYR